MHQNMSGPQVLFGGAAIGTGAFSNVENVKELFEVLQECKIGRIDSAAIYPMSSPGMSEQLLGDCQVSKLGIAVDTKIQMIGPGSLNPSAIAASVAGSLSRLKTEVCVPLKHWPAFDGYANYNI